MIELKVKKELNTASGKRLLDLDLQFQEKEITAVMGPSGAGKTTLLRIMAGLSIVESGFLKVKEEVWLDTSRKLNLPTRKRSVGMVFQDYALFPNMTVRENLEFALKKKQPNTQIEELISIMDLEQLQDRKPAVLSGGQQQRVAVARALVRRPDVLLLDEPLSALDVEMRQKLQDYLLKVQEKYPITTLLVSHDPLEISKMAKQVVQLQNGRVLKSGPSKYFFESPSPSIPTMLKGRIEKIDDGMIHIKVGHTLIPIPLLPATEKETYQIGEIVEFHFDVQNPLIKKTAI